MGNDTLDYEAHISGWSVDNDSFPRLDSIRFNLKGYNIHDKQVITIEKITRQKRNKWHISPSIGVGYGFKSKEFEPYIGIGVSYKF